MKKYIIFLSLIFQTFIIMAQTQSFYIIHVDGACGMCAERIEHTTSQVSGVEAVQWDMDTKQLAIIASGDFDIMDAHQAIAEAGHDTDQVLANDEVYNDLPGCCAYRSDKKNALKSKFNTSKDVEISIWVDGICGMCKDRIELAAQDVDGIKKPKWNVDTKLLTFKSAPNKNLRLLYDLITNAGHDTEFLDAPKEAYDNLHACCKYRDEEIINQHLPEDDEGSDYEVRHRDTNLDESDTDLDINTHRADDEHRHGHMIVEGMVYEHDEDDNQLPLVGVNVFWSGDDRGVVTDEDGFFVLKRNGTSEDLVIQYVGYDNDTIDVRGQNMLAVVLSQGHTLDAINVVHKQKTTQVSFLDPLKVQRISEKELLKAACCNLSESFETTPSVDVSSTDAVTGTRRIELLGLSGANIQITRENMPYIRGLSAIYGLEYIPGPWISGIQLNTGAGSVVNGFESITGQINVELKKPNTGDRAYINLFGSDSNRFEANFNGRVQVNEGWSTAILLHQRYQRHNIDRNNDGFKDHPNAVQTLAINRWMYQGKNGWMGQFGLGGLSINSDGGAINFDPDTPESGLWGNQLKTKKIEGWGKLGRVFPDKPNASFGLQVAGSYHDQEAYFGTRDYDAIHRSLYANAIFQNVINNNTDHKFKTGLSFQLDNLDEDVVGTHYDRNEVVPGAFLEYTYTSGDKFSTVMGLRGDVHNQYGLFFTPRLHARYAIKPTSVFRFSGGRGQRTATIFAENIGLFASSREIQVNGLEEDSPYGLRPEVAWNVGLSYTQEFIIDKRSLIFEIDLNRTQFTDQVVVDYDASPRTVSFYNLEGTSYSNSLQLLMNYELLSRFDVRLAYRYNDVQVDYQHGRLRQPLSAPHRAFINLAYTTLNKWGFDFTMNRIGEKRIPSTASNPEPFRLADESPAYIVINAQISKSWSDRFDLYLGAENLFNYRQDRPILSSENPWSDQFDASLIWGPVLGRRIYGGLRYRI